MSIVCRCAESLSSIRRVIGESIVAEEVNLIRLLFW
jgi:hypothetical protein